MKNKCLITYTKQVLALGVVIVTIALALIVTVLIALGLGALLGLFLSFANGLMRLAVALGWIISALFIPFPPICCKRGEDIFR